MRHIKPALLLAFLMGVIPAQVNAQAACTGTFVNPMTDICWSCIFPMTIGSVPIIPGSLPDTRNPVSPISFCPKPPPIFMQIGLNIGYWEPDTLVDVTRVPLLHGQHGHETRHE